MGKEVVAIAAAALLLLKGQATPAAAADAGMIEVALTPSSGQVDCGDRLTVTLRMAGYTAGVQIDGYNVYVHYPSSLFEFVAESLELGTSSGPNQQWLSKPTQDAGYELLNFSDAIVPGTVAVSMTDLSAALPQGGVTAESGYLLSFALKSISIGNGSITLDPYQGVAGAELLYDPLLQPVSVPALGKADVTVNNPLRLSIALPAADKVELRWTPTTGVTLERAANVSGPWDPVLGAISPMSIQPTDPRRFYRLSKL